MTTPYIGEIQLFGFNYVPAGWASCNGATLQLRQFPTLFALIGTQYGGDGVNTFQLPNLTGRAPCGQGTGTGLTPRTVGDTFGEVSVQLNQLQMPIHTHQMTMTRQPTAALSHAIPALNDGLQLIASTSPFLKGVQPNTTLSPKMISPTGQNQAHENRQPLLALNYCIALEGEFPSFD